FESALDWFVADPMHVNDRLRSLIVCRWERGATGTACSVHCCSALTTSAALAGALLRSSGHRFPLRGFRLQPEKSGSRGLFRAAAIFQPRLSTVNAKDGVANV